MKKLGIALVCVLCFARLDAAATVYYVDAGRPDDTGAGTTWATAKKTIQAGINAGAGTDEVWVKAGTYIERITLRSSCGVYGGFAGTETLRTQRNWTTNVTIIDGNAGGSVVTMSSVTNTTLDGFTVQNGSATNGGGIYCSSVDSTNIITNCTISGNTAGTGGGVYGGGIFNNCTISGNAATNALSGGGGVYGGATLNNCTISGNTASAVAGKGGGVNNGNSPRPFTNCIISGNRARDGGGVYGLAGSYTNCTISANVAGYFGGGVYVSVGSGTFTSCTISGNTASDSGGVYGGGTFTNCTISGNQANNRGAVYCRTTSPIFTNCTIANNVAAISCGGIGWYYWPTFRNCAFYGNSKQALYEESTTADPVVTSCLFYGNPDGDYYDEGTTVLTGAAAINALAGNSGNVDGDPLFVMDGPGAITGTWTAAPIYNPTTWQTTLTNAAASYTPNAFAGRLINADTSQLQQALIVSNTTTQVVVWGDVTGYVASGETYKLIDYHLQVCSAAVDTGTGGSGVPTTDIESSPRPVDNPGMGADGTGSEYDIGAYEAPVFTVAAPSSPGSTDIDLDTITWTWAGDSCNETGFKVYDDPGAGPPTTLQTTTPANATFWQHNGLSANTQYAFQAAATNGVYDSTLTANYTAWTLIEAVSGLTFSGVAATSISVASTNTPSNLSSGTSGLYFANTTTGTNSGWQQSNTPWVSGSLTPNTQYAFSGQSRNGASVTTMPATDSKHTLAGPPSIGNNISCDKSVNTPYPGGATFTFSNPAGFGAGTHGGSAYMATKFTYVWDTNATYTFTGTEADWNSGALPQSPSSSDSYYLHLQSYNAEGVANSGTLDYGPFVLDATPPTPVITGATTLTNAGRTLTINFGEVVIGFTLGDISVTNGTATNLQPAGAASSYTVDILGSGTVTVSVSIEAGVATDLVGNPNNAMAAAFTYPFDNVAPTPVITGATTLTNATRILTIAFGENVTGFSLPAGVSVTHGTASNLQPTATPGEYTVDILGTGANTVSVAIPAGVAMDNATNPNNATAAAFTFPFDGVAPTATITLDDPSPTGADAVRFSVDFSESVGSSFTAADVSLTGTLAGTPAVSGADPNYTVTATLTDPDADGTVGISVGTAVTDLAGNACAGGASLQYQIWNWHEPWFIPQPAGARKYVGNNHTFSTTANCGASTLVYQWKWDDGAKTEYSGPATPTWNLTGLTLSHAGSYWCEATYGGVTHGSAVALLEVQPPLQITEPPQGGQTDIGTSHTFTVTVTGGYDPLTYAWYKDGQVIPDAPDASEYTLTDLEPADSGSYTVVVTDDNGAFVVSAPATLQVGSAKLPAPGVLALIVLTGGLIAFGVRASRKRNV